MTTLGVPEDEQFRDHGSLLDPNCPAADVAWPGVDGDAAVPACWMLGRRFAIVEPVSGCTLLLRGELSVDVAEVVVADWFADHVSAQGVPEEAHESGCVSVEGAQHGRHRVDRPSGQVDRTQPLDRKSTRLNSSHVAISYAVFCLKKKTGSHITSQVDHDGTRPPR